MSLAKPAFPVRPHQVTLGEPLAFDVFDAHGRLLLGRDHVVQTEAQLERLLDQGLYSDVDPEVALRERRGQRGGPRQTPQVRTRVSIFSEIEQAGQALAALLASPPPDFAAQVQAQAVAIRRACTLDADAALAHVLLGKSLPYPVRQMVNCAVLVAVMSATPGEAADAQAVTSLVAAALTMNVSMLEVQATLYTHKEMTDEQRAAVRAHPQASAALLRERGVAEATWLRVVEQHHELLDGSGYPKNRSYPGAASVGGGVGRAIWRTIRWQM